MFKRRNPYDLEQPSSTIEEERRPAAAYRPPYQPPQESVPPRIFETPETNSPYRTPAQAYPHGREEAQDALNADVSKEEMWRSPAPVAMRAPGGFEVEEPETVLGEGICIKGRLEFQRFLRVDGEFEGDLDSNGKIVVGPTGVVRANIELHEAIIEGRVEGNITVSGRCELRGDAKIYGSITARLLSVDEGVTIQGEVNVSPQVAEPLVSE